MTQGQSGRSKGNIFFRIVACLVILGLGVAVFQVLKRQKKPPREKAVQEHSLQVQTRKVIPEDVEVVITGYGTVRPKDTVSLAPEVTGKVRKIHPRLEPGEIIPKGELLFALDDRDYKASVLEAAAGAAQLEATASRLAVQEKLDTQRLATLKRSRDLARAEFVRLKNLYEKDKVGTRSQVEQAERAFNAAADAVDQMALALAVYPIQIKETNAALTAARARQQKAALALERCRVVCPFTARIVSANLEKDQYVLPQTPVITLADDSSLEIQVPLDSVDARKWLRFAPEKSQNSLLWFHRPYPAKCRIQWTEDADENVHTGVADRVVRFDESTRTLALAVRVTPDQNAGDSSSALPLADGMFCAVHIPGKSMKNVFRLPRWAVSFEGTVYLAEESRLKTRRVTVVRTQGETTFVSRGLAPGDEVITTRLVDPLENSLLKIKSQDKTGPSGKDDPS